jgi:hypothetical protein
MSRKFTILAFFVSIALWLANSGNPPNGNTGAPGNGTCSSCHTLGGGTQDGEVTIQGLPAMITANTAYVLTLTNSNPNGVAEEAGFQMVVLNANDQQAGTLSSASATSAIEASGGRQYWEHRPSQPYPANNMVSWTVTWTSPNGPAGTITAYAAGNIANGNNATSGDLIDLVEVSGELMAGQALTASIDSWENVSCNGGNDGSATVSVEGGVPPYTYSWSNGGNTATINNIGAGTYTVTVSDNGGSSATDNVAITAPPAIVFTAPNITHVSCNGGSNGAIMANVTGGVGPYDFAWSNGDFDNPITGLTSGNYTVTVTDGNACTKTATYTVNQPAAIIINLTALEDESCAGEEDGSITIAPSGGAAPLFAEWSNGAIGNTITDLEPGTYAVTVTDNNDCTETETFVIDAGGTVDVDLINLTHVSCNGGSNGAISVNASGGEAPYTYSWSNGASGSSITNLTAGNYLLTATDNNGCDVVSLYTINQPAAITIGFTQAGTILCNGVGTVDLTAIPANGQAPYSGVWSTGAVGLNLDDVGAGTYTITVTDNLGCTATGNTTVNQPALLVVTVSTTDETSAGANDGTATATPTGGTGALTYAWSNGGSTSTITGLAPGQYTVTVTDANGCTSTASGQVDAFGCALDVTLGPDASICLSGIVVLTPTVTGATGAVGYIWSTGENSSTIAVGAAGEYCVTVTDEAGCQDADCITVTIIDGPVLNCPVTNESAPGANDGAIGCETNPGLDYVWSNGATTPAITGLSPGIYCVTATDLATGCSTDTCFTVQAGNCQLIITSIITDVLCNADNSGSVAVNVMNGTPPITFAWSNGDTDANLNNVVAGTYSVTISDAANCIEIREYTVNQPDPLTITLDSIHLASDFPSGAIFITVNGGNDPYVYAWSGDNGQIGSNEDFTDLDMGTFAVVVTDANGCTASIDSIFVDLIESVGPNIDYKALKVYPVPFDNMLFLDIESNVEQVILTAIDGRTVLQTKQVNANRVDVASLEAGWYLLRVFDGEQWYIARLVK